MSRITHPAARDCLAPCRGDDDRRRRRLRIFAKAVPPPGRGGSAIENGLVCSNPDAVREGIVPEPKPRRAKLAPLTCCVRSQSCARASPSVKFALRSRQRVDGDEVTRVTALSRQRRANGTACRMRTHIRAPVAAVVQPLLSHARTVLLVVVRAGHEAIEGHGQHEAGHASSCRGQTACGKPESRSGRRRAWPRRGGPAGFRIEDGTGRARTLKLSRRGLPRSARGAAVPALSASRCVARPCAPRQPDRSDRARRGIPAGLRSTAG